MDILWDKTVKIIKETVSQQNFETWIRPIRITLMEGHHLPEDPETWRDLARSDGTLVIYMGTRRAPEIAQSLLEHGADPAMPVALMEKACCPDQTTTYSCLSLAAKGALCPLTDGPGILLLGNSLSHRTQPESRHESVTALSESGGKASPPGGRCCLNQRCPILL